jgi:excisionase family DNA binding protein
MTEERLMVWLTMKDAAARTGYTVRTLERYIDCGRLLAYKGPGGHLRLKSTDVDGLFTPVGATA